MPQADQTNVEIEPEPDPEERAAILTALARALRAGQDGRPGAWWGAGLRGGDGDDA